ncbi:hypothetical protein [Flavobacterium sp. FlaQc-47]|uniref:hypothetical protein n=1 Tax=Flavobacterium sp. FlaQc-47 TaxID=3374180 RepID=UPI0037567A0F
MKNVIIFFIIILFFSCKKGTNNSISAKERNNQAKILNTEDSLRSIYMSGKNIFSGDSILAIKNYFDHLTENKGYLILKKQNESYQKHYANFINIDTPQSHSTQLNFKFEKQFLSNEKKYRIVLYTLIDNKKKDSIEFYRNVNDLKYEPSNYTCLSYLDFKNKKIWQIKYFSSPINKSVGYILYEKNKVMANGKIEKDSLYYLDESLDVEMEKNNLYY